MGGFVLLAALFCKLRGKRVFIAFMLKSTTDKNIDISGVKKRKFKYEFRERNPSRLR